MLRNFLYALFVASFIVLGQAFLIGYESWWEASWHFGILLAVFFLVSTFLWPYLGVGGKPQKKE